MRAAIALLLITSACFPESARHRRYANVAEGAALVGGIVLQYVAKQGKCMERPIGAVVDDCDQWVGQLDNLGLIMIFSGLVGFAATTITADLPPDVDDGDTSKRTNEPADGAWQSPQSFCPAMWAGNVKMAEDALITYVKSVGAVSMATASDALHAWLARQTCVVVEEEADLSNPRIHISVPVREMRYAIDVSASPFVVLIAN